MQVFLRCAAIGVLTVLVLLQVELVLVGVRAVRAEEGGVTTGEGGEGGEGRVWLGSGVRDGWSVLA